MEVVWGLVREIVMVVAKVGAEVVKADANKLAKPCVATLVAEVVKTHARHLVVETVAPDVEEVVKQLVLEHVAIHVMDHVIVIMQIQQKKIQ